MSDERSLARVTKRLASSVFLFGAPLFACGLSGNGADLESIRIEPASLSVAVDDSAELDVILHYDDQFEETAPGDIQWTTSDPAIASIDREGHLRGEGIGIAQISATYDGMTSAVAVAVAGIPKVLRVQAAASSLPIGLTLPYAAELEYRHGERVVVTSAVDWTSSATGIAGIDATGVARAVALGQTVITATGFGLSATRNLDVKAAVTQVLAVTPGTLTLPAGQSQDLTADCTFSDGNRVTNCRVRWESSNPAVAKVDGNGLVTALAPGQVTITARDGVAQTTIMAVIEPALPPS